MQPSVHARAAATATRAASSPTASAARSQSGGRSPPCGEEGSGGNGCAAEAGEAENIGVARDGRDGCVRPAAAG